jgi:hypothetical protein
MKERGEISTADSAATVLDYGIRHGSPPEEIARESYA